MLRPWTRYETNADLWIGTTDGAALLGVRDGEWVGLENPIVPSSWYVLWTGMLTDYRTISEADEACGGYSDTAQSGWAGYPVIVDLSEGKNFLQAQLYSCASWGQVICAEQ